MGFSKRCWSIAVKRWTMVTTSTDIFMDLSFYGSFTMMHTWLLADFVGLGRVYHLTTSPEIVAYKKVTDKTEECLKSC